MQLVGKLMLGIFWIAAALFILAASAASAQTYPPNADTLDASVSDSAPAPGSTVEVYGTVRDDSGNPLAGVTVTFTITENPGGSHFANGSSTITAVSDASGRATALLSTGTIPGVSVVRVDANGLVSQVTVTTGSPQSLPRSGNEPGSGIGFPSILALAAGIALIAGGGAVVALRKRQAASI